MNFGGFLVSKLWKIIHLYSRAKMTISFSEKTLLATTMCQHHDLHCGCMRKQNWLIPCRISPSLAQCRTANALSAFPSWLESKSNSSSIEINQARYDKCPVESQTLGVNYYNSRGLSTLICKMGTRRLRPTLKGCCGWLKEIMLEHRPSLCLIHTMFPWK